MLLDLSISMWSKKLKLWDQEVQVKVGTDHIWSIFSYPPARASGWVVGHHYNNSIQKRFFQISSSMESKVGSVPLAVSTTLHCTPSLSELLNNTQSTNKQILQQMTASNSILKQLKVIC